MKSTRLPLPLPLKEWMASDLSSLALLVIQIDGIHMDEDLILVAAIGVDATRPVPMPPQPR
jgi:hypothetical protein